MHSPHSRGAFLPGDHTARVSPSRRIRTRLRWYGVGREGAGAHSVDLYGEARYSVFRAPRSDLPAVAIEVEQPEQEGGLLSARTLRHVTLTGRDPRVEDLGWSRYRIAGASPRAAPHEPRSAEPGVSRD